MSAEDDFLGMMTVISSSDPNESDMERVSGKSTIPKKGLNQVFSLIFTKFKVFLNSRTFQSQFNYETSNFSL